MALRIPVRLLCLSAVSALVIATHGVVRAEEAVDVAELGQLRAAIEAQRAQLENQQRLLEEQARQLAEQQRLLEEQQRSLERQIGQVEALRSGEQTYAARQPGPVPATIDSGGVMRDVIFPQVMQPLRASLGATMDDAILQSAATGATDVAQAQQPVGTPPPDAPPTRPEVQALAEQGGVLTRRGGWVVEPSLEFIHSSQNRLVFRGASIIDAVLLGVIEASDADRDTLTSALNVRYGITDDLEAEVRLPFVYRSDRVTNLVSRTTGDLSRTTSTTGYGLGDIEAALHYQINEGRDDWPVFVGNLRVKSTTGLGPFEVDRDTDGIETELATGSGFWAVEPSITAIYPTSPAVLFGNLSYTYNMPAGVNRTIGDAFVGDVDPGDAIGINLGMGFGINENTSFSLGYKHNYIFESVTEINGRDVDSEELHIGALTFNLTQRIAENARVALDLEAGVTADAPDIRATLRVPFDF
ncbi:MAG: transporter [Alphaproteobacteria bacterium]